MCRANSEGGRRCESHSNNLRFKAAKGRAEYALENKQADILSAPADSPLPTKPLTPSQQEQYETGSPLPILHKYVSGKYTFEDVREAGKLVDELYDSDGLRTIALEREITGKYGSALGAIQFVGVEIAGRAEEYAGITGEQLKANLEEAAERLNIPVLQAVLDDKISQGYSEWLKRSDNQEFIHMDKEDYDKAYYDFMDEHAKEEREAYSAAKVELETIGLTGRTNLAEGYRKALEEIRPCGGDLSFGDLSDDEAKTVALQAAQIYPTDWLQRSNKEGNLTVIGVVDRAHYSHQNFVVNNKAVPAKVLKTREEQFTGTNPYIEYTVKPSKSGILRSKQYNVQEYEFVNGTPGNRPFGPDWEYYSEYPSQGWRRKKRETVKGSGLIVNKEKPGIVGVPDGYSVAAHELGHRMERIARGLPRMEAHWINKRTTGSNGVREPLVQYETGRDDEYVRKDSFISSYIGKEYEADGWHHEAFTVGVQSLFGGDYGGLVGASTEGAYAADEDMRTFILGVMGSAGLKQDKWI